MLLLPGRPLPPHAPRRLVRPHRIRCRTAPHPAARRIMVSPRPPTPSPGRRTPAGPGPFGRRAPLDEEHEMRLAPDMERALGALPDFPRRDILLRFYAARKPRTVEECAPARALPRPVPFDHSSRP